jgi:hypothetical protein
MSTVNPPLVSPAGSAVEGGVGRQPRPGSQRAVLPPLEQATAAAERCYRRSYCAALLSLLAAGRRGSLNDIAPLLLWGTPPARAPVAPTTALALLDEDPDMRAELRSRLDEALAARLRPVTGCPGHYVLIPAAGSAGSHHLQGSCIQGSTNYDSGSFGLLRKPPPVPLLVRAGWGSWALRAAVDGRDSCSQAPARGAPKLQRSCGVEGWVIEVFLPEESCWVGLGGDFTGNDDMPKIGLSVVQNALAGTNPFYRHKAEQFHENYGLWDTVLRPLEEVSDCSDSTGSDCAEEERGSAASAQKRKVLPEHRWA